MRLLTSIALLVTLAAGAVFASPTRSLSDITGAKLPKGQWFIPANTLPATPHSIMRQFYDNPAWPSESGPGWGNYWTENWAIKGIITNYTLVDGLITEFTVAATVTDDTYEYIEPLTGTAATFGTFKAPDISELYEEPMFNVHLTANFADKDSSGTSNIYAVGYDELAYYGTSSSEPPSSSSSGYRVPCWNFGDIALNGSVSKLLTFKIKDPVGPGDAVYEWIVWDYDNSSDIFASRTRTVKIPMFPTGVVYDDNWPWPNFDESYSCNVSVFYDEKPFLTMRAGDNNPFSHYWWNGVSRGPTEMMQSRVFAGHGGQVSLKGITLKALGSGDDTDIETVSVYQDPNETGRIDYGDILLGKGSFNADDGTCTITFANPPTIPSPSPYGIYIVVAYTLKSGAVAKGTYNCRLIGVDGTIPGTTTAVPTYGLPVTSCVLSVADWPQIVMTIGEAKKLPADTLVMLQDKAVTGQAGTSNTYIEDQWGISGIALTNSTSDWRRMWVGQGDFVTVVGKTGVQESDGQAVIKDAMVVYSAILATPPPIFMSCKSVGGSSFGIQRGTVDRMRADEPIAKASVGLNNVGLLVKVCGNVTYKTLDSIWIDDGSNLWDGKVDDALVPVRGLRVLLSNDLIWDSTLVPSVGDYVTVTGIVTTQLAAGSTDNPKPLIKAIGVREAADISVTRHAE